MKKRTLIYICFIFILIIFVDVIRLNTYRVIEVTPECNIIVDLNRNYMRNDNEELSVKGIVPYCSVKNITDNKNIEQKFSENEYTHLILKTKEFYKRLFLNSLITFDKDGNIYANFQPASKILLNKGYAYPTGLNNTNEDNTGKTILILQEGRNKTYYRFNIISRKYHTLDCTAVKNSKKIEILSKEELPKNAKPCGYCILHKGEHLPQKKRSQKNKIGESYKNFDNIEIFHSYGAGMLYPSSDCTNRMCKALLKEIETAKNSIDIASYELSGMPAIIDALKNAKNRGVKIRFATDNSNLTKIFQKFKPDDIFDFAIDDGTSKESHRLMHNKFFIFDGKKVWTGSSNITPTSISGFNANTSLLISSEEIAKIFEKEFDNFINGRFHSEKEKVFGNSSNNKIEVYFSPQNSTINQKIINKISNAKMYIHVPAFIITHKKLTDALIDAHKRGVDVKIITDANSAKNKYSTHSVMRNSGIPVKTENFAGTLHMKNIIIDGETVITGSMNFTKSGEQYNDENTLIIKDREIAGDFESAFQKLWAQIPDKYLHRDPLAESFESVGSCSDGIDNNYNGLTDKQDNFCKQK